jgi:hypothetical protein
MATGDASTPITNRQRMLKRKQALWNERSSWITHYQEISDYIMPRAGRYFVSDRNKGNKRHNAIYDNTSLRALRVLAAGMMAGMTSPARPWFRLALTDRKLMETGPVKVWLNQCNNLLRDVFNKSNTYRSLHSGYEELGAFGTAASIVLPNFDNVIHHYPLTAGEYAIATNDNGVVDTIYREFDMTVAQMVARFGRDRCSQTVRNMYDRHNLDQWVTVIQAIEPRHDRDPRMKDSLNMKWKSCYIEAGANKDDQKDYLNESGFPRFPAVVSRWVTTGGDIYGTSPGMEALGDVKQLQHEQLRKSQVIDYQTNPPLQVPTGYKDHAKNRLPGGVFHVDTTAPGGGVRSAFDVNLRLDFLLEDIKDVRTRIDSAFYADLFLMLSQMDRSGVTATEVAERHEEKLLMLGPVLERLHNELLNPLIDITFAYCEDAGILPEPPPELEGMELNVEFISTLAQAQRAVGAASLDRLLGVIGNLVNMKPDITDKVDFDQAVDDYAEMYGVNPELIVPDDAVAKIRAARAEQMKAQEAAANVPAMAGAAKDMSQIDMGNATDVMSGLMGYSTPAA